MFTGNQIKSSYDLIAIFARIADAFVVIASGIAIYLWRFQPTDFIISYSYATLLIASVPLFSIFMETFGLYRSWRGLSLFKLFSFVVLCWLITIFLILSALFLLKISQEYSRIWLTTWFLLTPLFLIIYRSLFYTSLRLLRSKGINNKNVLIFGSPTSAKELIALTQYSSWAGFTVVGFVDCFRAIDADENVILSTKIAKVDLNQIDQFILSNSITECWISLPLRAEPIINTILHSLRHNTANIRYIPNMSSFRLLNHGITEIVGIPMIDLTANPMTGLNGFFKTALDLILGFIIFVLISPIMILIAIAVKLSSPGPVFFKQTRLGTDNKKFTIYKFRTMILHHEDAGQLTQAKKSDSRFTKIGSFLRRSSLDELPQFINVLQGRMSIVGPRPHALVHNDQYKDLVIDYMKRHKVKPGITGWAQVNGFRGETDTVDKMKKRVEFDLYYIENWSLWLDIKIIFLTIFRGFFNKNAY